METGTLAELVLGEKPATNRIEVGTTYRCGKPVVCIVVNGEESYLTYQDAEKLADSLPDLLRHAAHVVACEVLD